MKRNTKNSKHGNDTVEENGEEKHLTCTRKSKGKLHTNRSMNISLKGEMERAIMQVTNIHGIAAKPCLFD